MQCQIRNPAALPPNFYFYRSQALVPVVGGVAFLELASTSTGDGLGAYDAAETDAMEVIGLIRICTD